MNQTGQIVSTIAIVGCLVLALRNSGLRSQGFGKALRMIAIWAVIIVALVLVIQVSGFKI